MEKHAKRGLCFRSAMLTVAFLLMALIGLSASAYDFEIDGISYNIKSATDRTVEVASLRNVPSGSDCVIPESVTWQDTQYSVVEITQINWIFCKTVSIPASVTFIKNRGIHAGSLTDISVDEQNPSYCSVDGVLFNKDMTQILWYPGGRHDKTYSIPETVITVGDYSFFYNYYLEEIILSSSVESIGIYSFGSCYSLKSLDFPDSVKTIGTCATFLSHKLQSISIGKSLSKISDFNPFSDCNSLLEINVDKENKNFCSIDGVFYRKVEDSGLELISYPIGRDAELYSFPDNITAIGAFALSNCKTLSDLVLPNTVKVLEQGAFFQSSLKSITLSPTVSKIDIQVFDGCRELTEISVSKDNPVFSSLGGVLYNKNITSILCCPEAYPAVEFDIPESVSSIGRGAFVLCEKLEQINIPESVTNIEYDAFQYCRSLKSIIIPNSVEVMREMILYGCKNLQSVTIGSSVRRIDGYAFCYCNNISNITCLPTVPPEVSGIGHFSDATEVYQNATLYVPNGCKEAYSTAEMWSNFQNIVEMEPVGISDINAAGEGVSVTVENGAIVVTGADGSDVVEVYAADGRCVYRGNGKEVAGLAHGLYIVRVGTAVSKVVL